MPDTSSYTSDTREIGRELRADELHERQVVCVRREDRNAYLTLWVIDIGAESVIFYAGATKPPIHFLTIRQPDGTLTDDTGKKMFVHEYLGEV